MNQDTLPEALNRLPQIFASFGQGIDPHISYVSTGKGITLKTPRGTLFLYHSFIHKLLNSPDLLTEEELSKIALSIR